MHQVCFHGMHHLVLVGGKYLHNIVILFLDNLSPCVCVYVLIAVPTRYPPPLPPLCIFEAPHFILYTPLLHPLHTFSCTPTSATS